jgi:hypothetical protein
MSCLLKYRILYRIIVLQRILDSSASNFQIIDEVGISAIACVAELTESQTTNTNSFDDLRKSIPKSS